ncbi:MAG: MBL fold metallo-hydrolase [Bdellovibrionaceae bacterium]|nr:MBL fold metallo-hydrolase [Pseudobdellovibrionaceae bacterium]
MPVPAHKLKISRILHAGYIFECAGEQIAFDPIFENPFSKNCYAFPNIKFHTSQIQQLRFSAVFISHYHDDHCSLESLNLLERSTPIYIYCLFEELFTIVRSLGFTHVYSLTLDQPVLIGPFQVIPRKALDEDVDSLFQIKAAGLNVLNVVDSWIDEDTLTALLKNTPWDMILWPFQTMRELEVISPRRAAPAPQALPTEWIEQLSALNPRFVIPSSCQFVQENWSWYNTAFFPITYKQFHQEVEHALPNTKVVRLNPSASIELCKTSLTEAPPLTFIETIGEQNLDYTYVPNTIPQTTSQIAKNFSPLSATQEEKIKKYLSWDLIKKYESLEHSHDSYFQKPKFWRLMLYKHDGSASTFNYSLTGNNIKLISENTTHIDWLTEVPIAKLYAALEQGETLTSMYIRINDTLFPPDVEKEILDVEITLDPLIRCLFDGVFGAYQKAQLKRIYSDSKR